MSKIVVFTDTHMQAEVAEGQFDPDLQIRKGIAHVNEFNSDADLVIFCGDLTHNGDIKSYKMLRNRLEDLNVPYELLLGNHDNRENFSAIFSNSKLDEDSYVQQVIDLADVRLILLDTLNGPPYNYPFSHKGLLCDKRLAWLDTQLQEANNKPCIIFMHHPPHDTGFAAMDCVKLIEGDKFYDVLKLYDNVRQIVCGHIHRTISGAHKGIPFCVFKSTVGQMPMVFDLMDLHMEVNEPSAYGILFVRDDSILVQTEDFELSNLNQFKSIS